MFCATKTRSEEGKTHFSMTMNEEESLQSAQQELKRADHSIAVSLKYTRTVDVIKSIIERLINTISCCLDTLLAYAKTQKKTNETATTPHTKVEMAKNLYPGDKMIIDFCDFYQLLRKIQKARFDRRQEYRRHITMTAHLDNETIEITIDIITDYYKKVNEFLNYTISTIHATE